MKSGSKRWIGKSKTADLCEQLLLKSLLIEKLKQKIDEPITCDINLKCIFYYPNSVFYTKKGIRSKTIGDLDNLTQLPLDCLQKAKIIANDTIVCGLDDTRRMPIDGHEYFLKIEVSEFHG